MMVLDVLVMPISRGVAYISLTVMGRYLNVGVSGRPLAIMNVQPADLLPMDEALWDAGVRSKPRSPLYPSRI